jgi:hypothetical protein
VFARPVRRRFGGADNARDESDEFFWTRVGYEQFTKTTKQAVDAVDGNVEAAVSQFSPTVKKGAAAANAATAAAA